MLQTPTIFRINENDWKLKGTKSAISRVRTILRTQLKENGKSKFKEQELRIYEKDDVTYYMYPYRTKREWTDWASFLPAQLQSENLNFKITPSLLLFAEVESSLFVVIGGSASRIVIPFLDSSFGLDIYRRIVNPIEDSIITIRTRGLTGTRAGMSEQFRDRYRVIDFISFGKIPSEIHIELAPTTEIKHFNYLSKKSRNIPLVITVAKGIKFKRSLSFNDLHKLFLKLNQLRKLTPSEYLSSYDEIKNTEFIEKTLYEHFVNKIFDDYPNVISGDSADAPRFEFEFCHPQKIDEFYEADYYKLFEKSEKRGHVMFEKLSNRHDIYKTVIRRAVMHHEYTEYFDFKVYLQGVRVNYYQAGQKKRINGAGFLHYFTSEFEIKNETYFLVDTKWYSLGNSFIKDISRSAKDLFSVDILPKGILKYSWPKVTPRIKESDYNKSYLDENGYIVLDELIVDNLELCDIIHFTSDTIYLIHVKEGFGASVRELTNQIQLSARRLRDAISDNNDAFLEKVYNKLVTSQRSVNGFDKSEFVAAFKHKKIIYVAAVASTLYDDPPISESIERYHSNIAKYSIVQTAREMRADNFVMSVHQIHRS